MFNHIEHVSGFRFEGEFWLVFDVLSKLRTHSEAFLRALDAHLYMATKHIYILRVCIQNLLSCIIIEAGPRT